MSVRHHIASLHTLPVRVPTVERLVQELSPGWRVRHKVAEELLDADALSGPGRAG